MLLTFMIKKDGDFWVANCIEEDIVTQAKTLDDLIKNIKEAVEVHFYEDSQNKEKVVEIITINKTEVQINA